MIRCAHAKTKAKTKTALDPSPSWTRSASACRLLSVILSGWSVGSGSSGSAGSRMHDDAQKPAEAFVASVRVPGCVHA